MSFWALFWVSIGRFMLFISLGAPVRLWGSARLWLLNKWGTQRDSHLQAIMYYMIYCNVTKKCLSLNIIICWKRISLYYCTNQLDVCMGCHGYWSTNAFVIFKLFSQYVSQTSDPSLNYRIRNLLWLINVARTSVINLVYIL